MTAANEIQTAGRATVPWSWYSDPSILARELERIFRRTWQYAGHLGELQGPGSYCASATGPVPIVITLDEHGVLRGFLNVSRHRGANVATDARRRGTLQCPYHAWTYGLDGGLRAAPRSSEDPAFDATRLCLVPVAVDTWGPFVFANPDPGAEPLTDALGDLPEVVAAHGLDVGALRVNRRVHYELRANWKIALENYLECYHCPVNHPGLVDVIDERRLELIAHGLRTSQFAPVQARSLDGRGPIDARGEVSCAQNHLWFPTLKFNVLPGHPNLSIGPLWPTGPEDLRRLSRLLLRRQRRPRLDRRGVYARRPDRGGGRGARRGGSARVWGGDPRAGLGAGRRGGPDRPLPGLPARPPRPRSAVTVVRGAVGRVAPIARLV